MRLFTLLTLLLPAAFSQGSHAFECPDEVGLFPDVHDCTQYIECLAFEPITHKCPDGLVFNKTSLICDFRSTAGCDEV